MARPHHLAWLLAASALLSAPSAQAFIGRIDFTPEGDFSESALARGVRATQAQCDAVPNGLWAATPSHGSECIKYWAAGLGPGPHKRVLVYFHGDIWVGARKTSKAYLESSSDKLQADAEAWGKRLGVPYVFIGRPGTHGSSGDHMQRRRPHESLQISAALDQLKRKFQVDEFVIAGQSGGGHVTASLLTLRDDIVCAVPTSAPSSPRVRWQTHGWRGDPTGYADSYEPVEHLQKQRLHPALRVFVVGDPNDRNVLWPSQTILSDKLREISVPVSVLQGQGTGPDAHGMSNSGRLVAGWCFKDMSTPAMEERAAKGLKG